MDLVKVAALLGYSSIATTQIYTQPSEDDKAAAIAGLKWGIRSRQNQFMGAERKKWG